MARNSLPIVAPADHPLVAAWNEMLSTLDAYLDTSEPDDEPLWRRLRDLETQIENARPDDLVGLAVQCRYLEHSLSSGPKEIQVVLGGWIAAALSRLAGLEYVALPRYDGAGRGPISSTSTGAAAPHAWRGGREDARMAGNILKPAVVPS